MTIFNSLPFTLTNGTTADATQVMANYNQIVNDGNTNAAHNGANSDITSLSALSTALSVAQGGTGQTTGSYVSATAWTPSDQSGAGLTFTSVSVNYSRAGNLIYIYGTLTFPVTADGSTVKIGGLPVTVPNQNYAQAGSAIINTASLSGLVAFCVLNQTYFQIWNNAGNGFLNNNALSGSSIRFSFFYPAT